MNTGFIPGSARRFLVVLAIYVLCAATFMPAMRDYLKMPLVRDDSLLLRDLRIVFAQVYLRAFLRWRRMIIFCRQAPLDAIGRARQ